MNPPPSGVLEDEVGERRFFQHHVALFGRELAFKLPRRVRPAGCRNRRQESRHDSNSDRTHNHLASNPIDDR